MNREYQKWFSENLQRDMELLIFGHAGRAVLFFPTRMARFYDYENWGVVEALRDKLENGELQLFCVDSVDAESFYNQDVHPAERISRHLQYERYLLDEVLPLMRGKNPQYAYEVAGCSMGAFHAANMAFKHPDLFNKVVCMSGRYDLTTPFENFRDLFDGYHNEDIYFNMPRQYMANMEDTGRLDQLRRLNIILAVGETDPFKYSNYEISGSLHAKSVCHQLYTWNNFAHTPRSWKQMVKLYL